jgi:hypothetical protein
MQNRSTPREQSDPIRFTGLAVDDDVLTVLDG